MMGEELDIAEITAQGIAGDRAFALLDRSTGRIATAKNPRKWKSLLNLQANFVGPVCATAALPAVRVTLPDGTSSTTDERGFNEILSQTLQNEVTLCNCTERSSARKNYWTDIGEPKAPDDPVTFRLPQDRFFDCSTLHLLTTSTLACFSAAYPRGSFSALRFRPNIVLETNLGATGFTENAWIDRTLTIGAEVILRITGTCSRCVMTTLSQSELPEDPQILRTVARENRLNAGVYAAVERGGVIRRGDLAQLHAASVATPLGQVRL